MPHKCEEGEANGSMMTRSAMALVNSIDLVEHTVCDFRLADEGDGQFESSTAETTSGCGMRKGINEADREAGEGPAYDRSVVSRGW